MWPTKGSSNRALARYYVTVARLAPTDIRVFADIKKKHSAHALTADVSLAETAKAAEFFLVDGVIVTGIATGQPADPSEVQSVTQAVGVPTLVGSGITLHNLQDYRDADALIVGSSIKHGGVWSGAIDESQARALAQSHGQLLDAS
jgi:uncharacterized protein